MNSTSSTVNWKPIGQVDVIGGSLVFPPVSKAQGIYWFSVAKGSEVIAGYIGQTGRKNGLAGRFGNYRNRGNHPAYDNHGNLGTTSRNARKLINAIEAGKTVTVSVLDDPTLAGKTNAWRNELETDLIRYQLCQSGVEVWNVAKVVAAREVRVLTVIRPDPAGQAAHEAAFQLIPEELRQGLRRITDAIPMFKHDFESLAVEIFDAGRDLGHDEASDEVEEYRRAMQPCEREHPGATL